MFAFLGGFALFLFGLYQIRTSMENLMKGKAAQWIGKAAEGRLRPVILGAGLTAWMQSSTAVTAITVGMVENRIIRKEQAFCIVMGANLGTTATSWLVALGDETGKHIMGNTIFLVLFCGGMIGGCIMQGLWGNSIGKSLRMFGAGIGALFLGVGQMGAWVEDVSWICEILLVLGTHEITAVAAGILLICIVQSSSAGMGLLQVLAGKGAITASAGLCMILGENIGTCITTMAAGWGSSREAKSVTWFHLFFNVVGTAAALPLIWIFFRIFPDERMWRCDAAALALFHSVFNLYNVLIFLPFTGKKGKE